MKNKIFDVLGTILLFIGFFLAFLPHAVHTTIGLGGETSHFRHILIGMALVIISLVILIKNRHQK
ncbi:hypothetical protein HYX02_06385 [Candidatus Woesearchaeota archaeon]|nr:hypothetical protein [Candidatus Woesearchaeota archaeon]